MENAEKVRENRLRRMAERQGVRLVKSRRRDPRAVGFGRYQLDDGTAPLTVDAAYCLTMDDVERRLLGVES
jgi:hypothetical protein